jgi:cysteine desulfurase/selenocysteine lyase
MTTNIKKLRSDFPIFHSKPEWAYLDTAATSQMPQVVLDAMSEYHCAYRASVHRGLYREAERATEVYEQARATLARFVGATSEEVVFTSGATGASNMLAYMLEQRIPWRKGDQIVTTVMEHHASLLPLQELARRKRLTLTCVPLGRDFGLSYAGADSAIVPGVQLVSVMLASNVLGTINNVRKIARRAHEVGALVVCDATAAVGHLPIDVRTLGVDFLYFSGHKMCGPTGVGVLYGRGDVLASCAPGFFGGGMIEDVTCESASWANAPHRFEAGTPNIAGVIGMAAAAEYLVAHDLAHVRTYVEALVVRATQELGSIPGVRLVAAPPERNIGIVSFTVDGIHAHDVAEVAARTGVALRAGNHCALPIHKALEIPATVRASFYLYNRIQDVDELGKAVREAQKIFG